jgi:hypothetical protein
MVFHLLSQRTLPLLQAELLVRGYVIYTLDGRSIHDEGSFLQTFSCDVPFEVFHPNDLIPPVNWDAFNDCFSSGLGSRPDSRVAIIWEAADRMLDGNLPLLVNAIECINGQADIIRGYDPPIMLLFCLVGDGPNFPDYPGTRDTRRLFGPDDAEIPCIEIRMTRDNGDEAR